MYPNYIDKLNRQKEEIENMIRSYQQMTPVSNYINTNQTSSKDLIEWRILNENEEVDNLYVQNKTLFINDNLMVLKGIDGSLEKWEVKKIYPIDKKDKKINELEEKIKELEMKLNEPTKPSNATRKRIKSYADDDGNVESEPEATSNFPVEIQVGENNIPLLCRYGNQVLANQLNRRVNYSIGYGNENEGYTNGQFTIQNTKCLNPRGTEG